MTPKPPPAYPPTTYTRALERTDNVDSKPTLRITRGQYVGYLGNIANAAMLEDGSIVYVVRLHADGCVMRVAMGEDDVEALVNHSADASKKVLPSDTPR